MSQSITATSTSASAVDTGTNTQSQLRVAPPLLPAFLITGLLLAAIVFIIVWRHFIERRNAQREADDPTWPADGVGGRAQGPPPTLWDLHIKSENALPTWADIMPVSATQLRAKSRPWRPRYLVPSDRHVPFLTRMFGGERRPVSLSLPPVSVVAPTQPPRPNSIAAPTHPLRPLSVAAPPRPLRIAPSRPPTLIVSSDDVDNEDPVDRLQVTVLISLPHPRRVRRASYFPAEKEDADAPSSGCGSIGVGPESEDLNNYSSSDKGKKRSLETPAFCRYDPKGFYEAGEVALGTVILPFDEDESEQGGI